MENMKKDMTLEDYFSPKYEPYAIPSFLENIRNQRFCMPNFLYEVLSTPEQVVKKQV